MAFLFQDQNQGTRNVGARANAIRVERRKPFSFIRTLTVGFGFTPNLLTLSPGEKSRPEGRRSRAWALPPLPPVGNFTPP